MGRTYTVVEYLALVERIRQTIPDIVLTTDIICGFCSESDEDFQDTYRMVEQIQFDSAYIFKYSERKNTIAARKYLDDVPNHVKGTRVSKLVEVQRRITRKRNREYIGKDIAILVERDATRSSSQGMGKTDGNITVVWDKKITLFKPGTLITKTHLRRLRRHALWGIAFRCALGSLAFCCPIFNVNLNAKDNSARIGIQDEHFLTVLRQTFPTSLSH